MLAALRASTPTLGCNRDAAHHVRNTQLLQKAFQRTGFGGNKTVDQIATRTYRQVLLKKLATISPMRMCIHPVYSVNVVIATSHDMNDCLWSLVNPSV